MAVVTDNMTAVQVIDEALGAGRNARAPITASASKVEGVVTKSSSINLTTPANMSEAELTAYQTFIGGLDEIATTLEGELYKA